MDTWEKGDFTVVKDTWQDDVEDDWDASEDEKPVVIEKKPVAAPAKPKAKKEVVVAKEEPIESELDKKLRLQRLQEAADMDNAMALFGAEYIKPSSEIAAEQASTKVVVKEVDWLEALAPETQKDFDMIVEKIAKKFKSFEKHKLYIPFVENLTRNLLADREIPDIRKIASVVTDMASIKQKEKLAAAKKPAPPTLAGAKKSSKNLYADFGDFDDDGDGFD